MAVDTEKTIRNQVLYSIYVRNYSEAGTFTAVQADLDRIKALGTDIIWLLPIHPTGEKHRKGTLGSPYAIRDYRAVNPEFGTLDDFRHLVDAIHDRGMKCIIDVVYNHTSPDSWLAEHHPEWFFHKPDGTLGNRFGDWWDVADLDYSHKELWDYQIETLKYWARLVDAASMSQPAHRALQACPMLNSIRRSTQAMITMSTLISATIWRVRLA